MTSRTGGSSGLFGKILLLPGLLFLARSVHTAGLIGKYPIRSVGGGTEDAYTQAISCMREQTCSELFYIETAIPPSTVLSLIF